MLDLTFQEITHPDDLQANSDKMKKLIEGEISDFTMEKRYFRKDGSVVWINLTVSYMWELSKDALSHIAVIEDITKRKLAENALIESEIKFRVLFKYAPDAFFMLDLNSVILDVNESTLKLTGYKKEKMIGKNIFDLDLISSDQILKAESIMKMNMFRNTSDPGEFIIRNKKGDKVIVEISAYPIRIQDQTLLFGIARDITERKEMHRKILHTIIETEEKERRRFAQDLHDGLGPLLSTAKIYINAIDSSKELDQKKLAKEKSLCPIDESLSSIKEIANNISPHLLENFGLESAINSFINKINDTGQLHISIQSNIDKRLDSNIELALFRIAIELINNTIKYAQAKKIEISLIKKNGSIEFNYSDDGVGFNFREALEKSSGRGLSNIINRTKAINGQIFFDNLNDKGMIMNICLLNMNDL